MLSLFLTDAGFATVCVYDGQRAIEIVLRERFDLMVLDLMLPDVDGLSVCQAVRRHSAIPIIMLTAKSTEDDIVVGLEAGADDYICKPFGSQELLARIRRCLRRQSNLETQTARLSVGDLELCERQRSVSIAGRAVSLTKTEFSILMRLMSQPGRVFTRYQLLQHVFGPNYDGFERSIDTHIWNLRKKLAEPKGNPRYILSEPGVGYRLNDRYEK